MASTSPLGGFSPGSSPGAPTKEKLPKGVFLVDFELILRLNIY